MLKTIEYLLVGHQENKLLSEYRRAVITAYSIVIAFCTSIYYVVINWYRDYNPSLHFYYIALVVLPVTLWLNRRGNHWVSKSIMMTVLNFVIFAFSSREPEVSAAFLFFILSAIMALVLFDFRERRSLFFFIGLSIVLYFIARFTTFSLVPSRPIDPQYLERAYRNNMMIVYFFSIVAVYFVVKINFSVETSLHQREKQILDKNNTLVKTNEELDRFIYSTSHDLRAPLNSIHGLINISENAGSAEELKMYHAMMRERVLKLEKVLTDISQYSKNAKLTLEYQKLTLRDYVDQALYDIRFSETAANVRVTVDIDPLLTIETDPMRLSIILNNLISNAFKYSDPTKADQYVLIRARRDGERLTLTIGDNGEGIDPSLQPRIFDMFYRATVRSTGSGLGLYLVKGAVEKLGGIITVQSAPGHGTTFIIQLVVVGTEAGPASS